MDKLQTKAFMQEVEGKMLAVASEEVMDREGEMLSIDGWDLKNFKNNPQLLWYHNIRERSLPIGRAENIRKTTIDGKKKLVFEPVFEEITEFGRTVKKFFEEGFLNSFSVGFRPQEKEENVYLKQELLEISAVPVPALPSAQIVKRSAELGFNDKVVKAVMGDDKALGEILEDGKKELGTKELGNDAGNKDEKKKETKSPACRKEDETKNECVVRKIPEIKKENPDMEQDQVVAIAESMCSKACKKDGTPEEDKIESKKAVPFESHEKAPDSRDWDDKSAISRIRKWSENADEDTMDFVKYRKGFAFYNNEKVEDLEGYKLPHHDIQGATMVTVWRGVAASMALLLGAGEGLNIPEEDKKAVYSHLKKHYEEYDKPVPEYRLVQEQVLKGLDKEVEALNENYMNKKLNKNLNKIKDDVNQTKNDIKEIKKKESDGEMFIKALQLIENSIKSLSNKKGVK